MSIQEEQLMSRTINSCENCEWCVPILKSKYGNLPCCLLSGERKGLFETCKNFKRRTANHISM